MEVLKARHLPTLVEYVELTEGNGAQVAEWCGGEWAPEYGVLLVPTIKGQQPARLTDRIVKGTHDFYPVRADVFGVSYGPDNGRDWLAVREWLLKTLRDAKWHAVASPMLPGGFEGQAEVLSAALAFMDEQERQAL